MGLEAELKGLIMETKFITDGIEVDLESTTEILNNGKFGDMKQAVCSGNQLHYGNKSQTVIFWLETNGNPVFLGWQRAAERSLGIHLDQADMDMMTCEDWILEALKLCSDKLIMKG